MTDTFIREIPWEKFTDALMADYEKRGFRLVYTDDSVEVWCPGDEPINT
jgi:hypothetical protein